MSVVNGFGGDVVLDTGDTTMNLFVQNWTLEDTAQLHDVTVMINDTVGRSFLKGLETWTVTAEFIADSAMVLTSHTPGATAAGVSLDALGTGATDVYAFTGIVESLTFARDVDGLARGTIRIKGNQTTAMTRPS